MLIKDRLIWLIFFLMLPNTGKHEKLFLHNIFDPSKQIKKMFSRFFFNEYFNNNKNDINKENVLSCSCYIFSFEEYWILDEN